LDVNLACVRTLAGERVTVIRPFQPKPEWPGAVLNAGIPDLLASGAIRNLRFLGLSEGVSLWQAECVTCL